MKINKFFCLVVFTFFILTACKNNTTKEYSDTTTSGTIKISVDQTFEQIIDGELDTFHALYKYATVIPNYTSETQAYKDLIDDSARIIIVTRTPNAAELNYFEGRKLTPRITKIAKDAIAFIVNNDNSDTILNMEHIQKIFSGTLKNWSEISDDNKSGEIAIVFDNNGSSTARYVKDSITGGKDFPPNCFAVESNPQVIEYVNQHKNAIGVIGVNWISDGDDPSVLKFLDKIKTLAIVAPDYSEGVGKSYKPYQAFIATNYYPYTRDVYIISREARAGLGSGFAAFVAGDKGQRIILKSGIMPATQPVRIVGFRNNN